jgi:hypothetical protein
MSRASRLMLLAKTKDQLIDIITRMMEEEE